MKPGDTIIKPSIGRIVWFWPASRSIADRSEQPLAAIIAYVYSDDRVNLTVCHKNGTTDGAQYVLLWQEGSGDPPQYGTRPTAGSFCEWMPYQRGQAAKTDELQRQLLKGEP